jgi:Co/Zn/Cd efflux system component
MLHRGLIITSTPMTMLDPRTLGFQKLAALGALGASGALFLILAAVFVFLHPYPRGGMDGTLYVLTLMAFTGLLGVIIAVHLVFAHQLWYAPVDGDEATARPAKTKRKARS